MDASDGPGDDNRSSGENQLLLGSEARLEARPEHSALARKLLALLLISVAALSSL